MPAAGVALPGIADTVLIDGAANLAGRWGLRMTSAYVFDAYGTVLDIHSAVRRHAVEIGSEFQPFSDLWRAKQLEYAWVRTLMGEYASFWRLTQDALDFAMAKHPAISPELKPRLLEAYLRLDCYADSLVTLQALKAKGLKLAFLSNGSPEMLRSAAMSAGLDLVLDELFSVDSVGRFKTHPLAYTIFQERWALTPREISFVSCNRWDVAGAKRAGFRTIWLNRTDQPDEYLDFPPDLVIRAMGELCA
jgi:2-haloacid dehalogenase